MSTVRTVTSQRVAVALVVYVAWVVATVFSMRWAGDSRNKSLLESVSQGVGWGFVVAIAVLAAATLIMGWRDLRFVAPKPWRTLRLLWFPALYLVGFAGLTVALGAPPLATAGFLLLNTFLVGLSEEWMFRGVLFQALLSRLAIWPAMVTTSLLFGSVHLLNVFLTGQLAEAAVQALTATLSGFVFMALLVRTGSLWVPIAYHALWDFGTFMLSAHAGHVAQGAVDTAKNGAWLFPLLLVLPNFLYAMYLLRRVRNEAELSSG